jgi:uncharacterized protein YecE (DUF72 family)
MIDGSAGRLYVGTSGFAYPDWAPLFYPTGTRSGDMLAAYAARLPAVELNNTFYQQPRPARVAAWLAATPADFRFAVKAQRGGSLRALGSAASQTVGWLTAPYRSFGRRLGCVLLRVPRNVARDDLRLAALLAAWPSDLPLTLELQHPSWHVEEVFGRLAEHSTALCATDLDGEPVPDLRLTGRFIYLRLRRTEYSAAELDAWAERLLPFLADGRDCYVFLRHDATGEAGHQALALADLISRRSRLSGLAPSARP